MEEKRSDLVGCTTVREVMRPADSKSTQQELFTASDAGTANGCSPTTIKRVGQELHLRTIKTKSGIHLFTAEMVRRIGEELARRSRERACRISQQL